MIGLDSNILLRHLAQDDRRQSPIASDIIENRLSPSEPGFVSVIAIVETYWVLVSRMKLSVADATAIIEALAYTTNLILEHHNDVLSALDHARTGDADFADSLIGALGRRAGCSKTLTFDDGASKLRDFKLAK